MDTNVARRYNKLKNIYQTLFQETLDTSPRNIQNKKVMGVLSTNTPSNKPFWGMSKNTNTLAQFNRMSSK